MSEVLENAMLSLVERLEKTLPSIEKLTGVNAASAVENKTVSESLGNQLAKVPAMIQALQKQAEKLEETARRVGEVKIPEEVKVLNHTKHTTEPETLKFLWIFFNVSVLILAGVGFWVYQAVNAQEAAVRALQNYQATYKPERVKWLY